MDGADITVTVFSVEELIPGKPDHKLRAEIHNGGTCGFEQAVELSVSEDAGHACFPEYDQLPATETWSVPPEGLG
jgi:hypothetical protein